MKCNRSSPLLEYEINNLLVLIRSIVYTSAHHRSSQQPGTEPQVQFPSSKLLRKVRSVQFNQVPKRTVRDHTSGPWADPSDRAFSCLRGAEMRFEAPSRGNIGPPAWALSPGWRYEALVFLALLACRVVLESFFRADSTLTHMKIQVTQLRLNSNPKFANLTQL